MLALVGLLAAIHTTDHPPGLHMFEGTCAPESHTAEGPLGSDLSQRHSRFLCDAAVITFLGPRDGRVLFHFAERADPDGRSLGFGAVVDSQAASTGTFDVDTVYLRPGVPVLADDVACRTFREGRRVIGIYCGGKVDRAGRRTVLSVIFNVTREVP